MNPYSRLVPRLNGAEIEDRFDYYLGLARKGVAGFIVFGGEIETVREGIKKLQRASANPLIIASDLEQGLGQQIHGGTIFPPAMAIASAIASQYHPLDKEGSEGGWSSNLNLLRRTFDAFAVEARYAGINTIFAPVLDINTNPDNPIIATRAFGEDPETVSLFGCEMVRVLQENGIIACGKHFPGHGDTEIDSHMTLPVVRKELSSLENVELVPFRDAIREGVKMIMLGHLSVPAIDPSGEPATISPRIISCLRSEMEFKGTVISDAMNMGALAGYDEDKASLMALDAGVDIILHPSDPDRTASYLLRKKWEPGPLKRFVLPGEQEDSPDFSGHQRLSDELARMAVTFKGKEDMRLSKPFLIVLKEDKEGKGSFFVSAMRQRYSDIGHVEIAPGDNIPLSQIPGDCDLLVAIFSKIRAWKGGPSAWLLSAVEALDKPTTTFISFGNPYVLRRISRGSRIFAYWDARSAQEAVAEILTSNKRGKR